MVKLVAIDPPPLFEPKRFGFMKGELKIPDNFDTMFQDEIIAMFESTD